ITLECVPPSSYADRAVHRSHVLLLFFFSSRRRHTRSKRDWSSDVCSSDLYQCQNCRLIFATPSDQPSKRDERARYDTHENDPADEGYRNFLAQLFSPLNERLEANSKGL